MRTSRFCAGCPLALLLVATLAGSVQSQPIWVVPEDHHRILLEFLKPDFKHIETTAGSVTWFLSGFIAVSDVVTIVAEIPYTYLKRQGYSFAYANDVGNMYLGVDLHGETTPVAGEIGVRLPTSAAGARFGTWSDSVDRVEAFVTDAVPFCAVINYRHRPPEGFVARIRGGVALWFPKGDGGDVEHFLLYGGQFGYAGERVNVLAGISGRWHTNSVGIDFNEASIHQLALAVDLPLGALQPGVSFRVPIDDDLRDVVNWVLGLTVAANLGRGNGP